MDVNPELARILGYHCRNRPRLSVLPSRLVLLDGGRNAP